MTNVSESPSGISGIRGMRRRVTPSVGGDLVRVRHAGAQERLPLIVEPVAPGLDPVAWARANAPQVEAWLLRFGAVMLHGFRLDGPAEFEETAAALVPQLFGEYGDLPKEPSGKRLFKSTPYPADEAILFHNESSHMSNWPMRIFFFSALAAETGGETPLLDCREAYGALDPEIREKFERLGLRYIRNFTPGVDVSWRQFFGTEDPGHVKELCAQAGADCKWGSDHQTLRLSQPAAAVRDHPMTGEKVFFNQILLHHPAGLPKSTRAAMKALFDENDFPRNVSYGDGTEIPDAVIEHVMDVYARIGVAIPWSTGDVIILDNMLASHGRQPFTGARKVIVAMGVSHH